MIGITVVIGPLFLYGRGGQTLSAELNEIRVCVCVCVQEEDTLCPGIPVS